MIDRPTSRITTKIRMVHMCSNRKHKCGKTDLTKTLKAIIFYLILFNRLSNQVKLIQLQNFQKL